MKVIDLYLAIERNKNIPKKVVYKYKTYRYYPEYKQYYREEYGDIISLFLEATLEDKVYLIEDTPKEDNKIEKVNTYVICDNDFNSKGNFSLKVTEIIDKAFEEYSRKLNEIIDRLNGE